MLNKVLIFDENFDFSPDIKLLGKKIIFHKKSIFDNLSKKKSILTKNRHFDET